VAIDKKQKRIERKQDIIHLAILVVIALVIGVYLIATTVLIAKDGVFYIERAQQLTQNPVVIIKAHPPGYPFLILIAHKFVMLFSDSSSTQTWTYSAQSITLLCKMLSIIPLYFIGKLLVGAKNSFWAVFVLMILPHSAKYCAEVLREWPYILFLSMGFWGLLVAVKQSKWWIWGLVGLSTGLGYLIRHESQQLIVYSSIWLTLCMLWSKLRRVPIWKIYIALAALLIGFALPAALYIKCTGLIIHPKAKGLIKLLFSSNTLPDSINIPKKTTVTLNFNYNTAGIMPRNVLEALYKIFQTIGEHLMWFFVLPLVIGLWYWLRGEAKFEEQFLIIAFILVNVIMMVIQHCYYSPGISRRWSLPLISVTICYVAMVLQIWGNWLRSRFHRSQGKNEGNPRLWFFILLVIGMIICLPKLFRPIGIDKTGYRQVAQWLKQNTTEHAAIAVPDRRICFYAERKGLMYDKNVPKGVKYIVKIVKWGEKPKVSLAVQEKFSACIGRREKRKRIIIYEVL